MSNACGSNLSRKNRILRFENAADVLGIKATTNLNIMHGVKMHGLLACTAVAFLAVVRAEMLHTTAQAALTLPSSTGRPCNVQYVVLHASISSSCFDQCSLLLGPLAQPQRESGHSGLDGNSASSLLPTNVVTVQHSAHKHILQISCQADSDCTASPRSWQVEKIGTGLLLAAQGTSQHPIPTSQVSCVQEVNSTVSIAASGKAANMVRPRLDQQLGTNSMLTWLLRAAVLASSVILQLSSR